MNNWMYFTVCLILAFLAPLPGYAEHPVRSPLPTDQLHLSPELAQLIKQEMNAIQKGMQSLLPAIASGYWEEVANIGEKIQRSYIMKQKLTPTQVEELHHVLPPAFQELDQSFHHSAGMLAHAAKMKNPDVVTFYFYKLIDTCVACHTKFAANRFPGLGTSGDNGGHRH